MFRQYQGLDLAAWDVDPKQDPAAPKQYRLLRTTTIRDLTAKVAGDLGEDPGHVRLWVMVNRQNKTVRPDQPLMDLDMTVDDAYNKIGTKAAAFRIWAEVADDVEGDKALWPNNNSPILLFVKCFDAEAQTLKGAGHIYIGKNEKVQELATPILQLMDWPAGTSLKLYEVRNFDTMSKHRADQRQQEIKPAMIEPMKSKQTLSQAEIQDGDVICFQKVQSEKE